MRISTVNSFVQQNPIPTSESAKKKSHARRVVSEPSADTVSFEGKITQALAGITGAAAGGATGAGVITGAGTITLATLFGGPIGATFGALYIGGGAILGAIMGSSIVSMFDDVKAEKNAGKK